MSYTHVLPGEKKEERLGLCVEQYTYMDKEWTLLGINHPRKKKVRTAFHQRYCCFISLAFFTFCGFA